MGSTRSSKSLLSADEEANLTLRRIPSFYKFKPKGHSLLRDFLLNKALAQPLPVDVIDELSIYSSDPDDLPINTISQDKAWTYFFVPAAGLLAGSGVCRPVPGGYWRITGPEITIGKEEEVIGFKTKFVFYRGTAPRGERTAWKMSEFRLNPELEQLKDPTDPKTGVWVACKVSNKDPQVIEKVDKKLLSGEVSRKEYVKVAGCQEQNGDDNSL